MKKFFVAFGAALLMVGTFSSCNKGASNANVSAEDKALGDSAATIIGQFAGARSASEYQRLKEMQPEMAEKFSKEAFLKGLKQVLDADTAQMAYYQGLQMGLQLVNPIIGINQEAGVPLSKDAVYAAFKKVYEQDSVADMSTYYEQYQDIMSELSQRAEQRRDEALANSQEAKDNLAAGEAYAAKMVKEGYTKAQSGLVYKIENPGTEPKVVPSDKVTIEYTGKLIDGTVFDSNEGHPNTMSPNQFIPGFKEALCMLGKGGQITAVIPTSLAYGVKGAGQQIGPNATLVFDIKVLDINPAK